MALPILDGNQSATTLSTILSSGQHITAHTVVSLGTQAITDMRGAVSGSVVSISNLPSTQTIAGTVTVGTLPSIANNTDFVLVGENLAEGFNNYGVFGVSVSNLYTATQTIAGSVTLGAGTAQIGSVTVGNSVTISSLPAISGTVTANAVLPDELIELFDENSATKCVSIHIKDDSNNIIGTNVAPLPISGTVTANLAGDVVYYDDPNELVAVKSAIYAQDSSNELQPVGAYSPLPISGTVTANTFAVQGTAVTTSNFTSITPSTVLANFNAAREVLTIFNEGAGNLHICAGATCTTIAYQVRLSSGDYYEVPNHQTTITHSAVFATAGTARVTQVS
jgi:hypothetical protein